MPCYKLFRVMTRVFEPGRAFIFIILIRVIHGYVRLILYKKKRKSRGMCVTYEFFKHVGG